MRSTMNISLPEEMAEEVRKEVRRGRYASVSEYFRFLMRLNKEKALFRDILESEREFADGKGRVLKNVKDLLR
jgi:putative addiction module CopG family antidote